MSGSANKRYNESAKPYTTSIYSIFFFRRRRIHKSILRCDANEISEVIHSPKAISFSSIGCPDEYTTTLGITRDAFIILIGILCTHLCACHIQNTHSIICIYISEISCRFYTRVGAPSACRLDSVTSLAISAYLKLRIYNPPCLVGIDEYKFTSLYFGLYCFNNIPLSADIDLNKRGFSTANENNVVVTGGKNSRPF